MLSTLERNFLYKDLPTEHTNTSEAIYNSE